MCSSASAAHLAHAMPLYCSWRCTVCCAETETTMGADDYQLIPEDCIFWFCRDDLAVPKEYFDDSKVDCALVSHPNGWAACLVPIQIRLCRDAGQQPACKTPMILTSSDFHLCPEAKCGQASQQRWRSRSSPVMIMSWIAVTACSVTVQVTSWGSGSKVAVSISSCLACPL